MNLLEARGISKSFRGLRAVHDASFDIAEGSINALIGPNVPTGPRFQDMTVAYDKDLRRQIHTAAAKLNGATDEEIRETVAMAAIVRHWSTVLNGMQVDLNGFKRETDTVLRLAAEKSKAAAKK